MLRETFEKIRRVSKSASGTVTIGEHCIMRSIRPELGSEVCIEELGVKLIYDGQVAFLKLSI